jgi:hypothetical protein
VINIPNLAGRAPCALCVQGELSVGGSASINGTNLDPTCGGNNKYGTYSLGATSTSGSADISGGAGGVAQNQPASSFNGFTFSPGVIDQLKILAQRNGTYFGPGFSGTTNSSGKAQAGTWTGSLTFNSSNKVANGVVFIDTTDGVNLDPSGTNTSTMASVDIHGNPFIAGDFSGYLVINGSVSISGNMAINGLVYSVNDMSYNGTGTGAINGLAVSRNVRDTSATSIDSTTGGNSRVNFNCANTAAPNIIGHSFVLVPGTYRELSD